MTTPPAPTEPPPRARRVTTAAVVMMVLLAVAGYAAVASNAVSAMLVRRSSALLAAPQSDDAARRLGTLDARTIRTAVAADPLDQRLANVAMVREARGGADARTGAWLATIGRLGWRDTVAVQNMLYAAAVAGNLSRVLDLSDALLRRRQLMDHMIPVLSTAETVPEQRARLVAKLVARPNWRGAYMATTAQLTSRRQLLARYDLIRVMQRYHAALAQAEVVPSINALDRAGLSDRAFGLWQSIAPRLTRPLDDTGFALASRSYQADHDSVPFQWQMMTGQGFSADASGEGSQARLSVDWDGRGVPVFAQQRTSATPGRYALEVAVSPEDVADLPVVAFRLMCDGAPTAFQPVAGRSAYYVTASAVPCAFPLLQVTGDVQSSAVAHQIAFERIVMRRLPAAGTAPL